MGKVRCSHHHACPLADPAKGHRCRCSLDHQQEAACNLHWCPVARVEVVCVPVSDLAGLARRASA